MKIKKHTLYNIIVLAALLITLWMIKDFILTLILAAIFAYILMPLFKKITNSGLSKRITAFCLTFIIFLIFIGFLQYGIRIIITEFDKFYTLINSFNLGSISPQVQELAKIVFSRAMSGLSEKIISLPMFLVAALIFFFALYYFLVEHKRLAKFFYKMLPFSKNDRDNIIKKIKQSIDAFVYVQVVIGLIQGVIAAVGFYIFGLPYALVAGIVAALLSILPAMGPELFYIPVSAYIIITGDLWIGIGLLVYGLALGSILDYIVRPFFFGKRAKLHPLITFIGIFGGLIVFGLVGIIIGPVLIAITLNLIQKIKLVS